MEFRLNLKKTNIKNFQDLGKTVLTRFVMMEFYRNLQIQYVRNPMQLTKIGIL